MASWSTLAQTADAVGASNASRPVRRWNRSVPSPHTSARASTSSGAVICSGDIVSGEPMNGLPLEFVIEASAWFFSASFEIPKSSTLIEVEPSAASTRNTFSALRSRWTMPFMWASAIAWHVIST